MTLRGKWPFVRSKHWFDIKRTGGHSAYPEHSLQEKLLKKEREIRYLEFQLLKVRADNTRLQIRRNELCPAIAEILRKPNDALRQTLRYSVRRTEDGLAWETVTEHCCLGGCDMGIYTFPAEREALIFAAMLDAVGYRPLHNTACHDCYAEYMRDSV